MASETPTVKTEYAHVVRTPGVVGGEPRIDGHRIRVRDVVAARDLGGFSPEEIVATVYPSVTLAQVYAALAYYEDHRDEIDRLREAESSFVHQWLEDHPELARDLGREKG
jgi:uncharacterized protein (DUF433 family)